TGPERVQSVGSNAKMNEFQAAMGICNLRHIESNIVRRKLITERYIERLGGVKGVKISPSQPGVKSNYSYFPILFDGIKYHRDNVYSKLLESNIHARKYFYPLCSDLECYEGLFQPSATPVAS